MSDTMKADFYLDGIYMVANYDKYNGCIHGTAICLGCELGDLYSTLYKLEDCLTSLIHNRDPYVVVGALRLVREALTKRNIKDNKVDFR